MKTFLVRCWTDDENLDEVFEVEAENEQDAEEAASLEYPNYDNYEVVCRQ